MNTSKERSPGTSRRWLATAIGGGAVVISLAFVAGRSAQPGLAGLEQKIARLEKLGERAPKMREVRTVVHERTVERDPAPTSAPQQEPDMPVAQPESEEEGQYRAEVIAEAQRKTLSDAFTSEAADASWSKQASETLRATYAGDGLEPGVFHSECRSTLCRMTFRIDDEQSRLEQFQRLKQLSPWPGHRHFTFDLETGEGTAYLSRESFELPSVDLARLEL